MGCQISVDGPDAGKRVACFQKMGRAEEEKSEVRQVLHTEAIDSKGSSQTRLQMNEVSLHQPRRAAPEAAEGANKTLLDRNCQKLEKFLKEMEKSPESFISIVECKRAKCFNEKVPFRGPSAAGSRVGREKHLRTFLTASETK
mmetsp:Transcript_19347/g.36336  ORF Transcript_19347/g.36336 Transcript_19347/m.36336 type:complete len:143 (+) Transcript_19347:56-484(+)